MIVFGVYPSEFELCFIIRYLSISESILQVNPNNRPPAAVISEQIAEFAASRNIDPKAPINLVSYTRAENNP